MTDQATGAIDRLPVTVIGGYLGAGKTTLVNHLLRNADGLRLAVLVNEFGALPIDRDLIEAQDDNVISIAGGCVCCSYGNDLVMAMIELSGMEPRPEHVLLEASGVALPGAIGATVGLLKDYVLDGIVVLADAETVETRAGDKFMGDTVRQQLGDADIVVLNKADLVAQVELQRTTAWLGEITGGARVIPAIHGKLAPEVVLAGHLGRERGERAVPLHDDAVFETHHFTVDQSVDAEKLAEILAGSGLVRAKGFVRSMKGELQTIQVVGRRWAVAPAPVGAEPGIVCIGVKGRFEARVFERIGLGSSAD